MQITHRQPIFQIPQILLDRQDQKLSPGPKYFFRLLSVSPRNFLALFWMVVTAFCRNLDPSSLKPAHSLAQVLAGYMAQKKRSRGGAPVKRSSQPSRPPSRRPQPWYRAIVTERIKLARERELRESLYVVRKIFSGFESYNARYPRYWTLQQKRALQRYAYRANQLLASPSILVKPRTVLERAALQKHTGQLDKRQIRFILHVSAPKRMRVRFVRDRARVPFMAAAALKLKALRVEIVDKVKGGEMYTQDYLFREILGYQPVLWDDFIDAITRLLPYLPDRTPSGEEATYTLLSMTHGPISSPVPKSLLLDEMQRWAADYRQEFTTVLIGVRYQGDSFKSFLADDSEYNQRQDRRTEFRRIRTEYQKAVQRQNDKDFKDRLHALRVARGLASKKKRAPKKKRVIKKKRVRKVIRKPKLRKKKSPVRKHK